MDDSVNSLDSSLEEIMGEQNDEAPRETKWAKRLKVAYEMMQKGV